MRPLDGNRRAGRLVDGSVLGKDAAFTTSFMVYRELIDVLAPVIPGWRAITSHLAIAPGANGSIDAFTADPAQLILDISGYFAP
jgi:hypothetical protein